MFMSRKKDTIFEEIEENIDVTWEVKPLSRSIKIKRRINNRLICLFINGTLLLFVN